MSKVGALDGVVIVDLTHMLAGPFATMMLADHGATVIKIERPGKGDAFREGPPFVDGMSHQFAAVNRGKHSVALDIETPQGRELLLEIIAKADVLVNNFRPGKLEKLGLGFDTLHALNPRLIYASISGFGQEGPMSRKPAFDPVIQAQAGLMGLTGEPGGPPMRPGLSWADLLGGVFCAQGVITALFERERKGAGQAIDISMFDALFFMLAYFVPYYQSTGNNPQPSGPFHQTLVPVGTYPTLDGHISLAPVTQSFWRALCRGLGKPEWIEDARYAEPGNRQINKTQLWGEICAITVGKTTAEWAEIMDKEDIPAGPILKISDLVEHPLVKDRNLLADLGWGQLSSPIAPFKLANNPQSVSKRAPVVGEDTLAILSKFSGRLPAELQTMLDAGKPA